MNLLYVPSVEKSFDNQLVINLKDFAIEPGKGYVIYGYNGCGKTTFLRLLSGLEKPTNGSVDSSMSVKDRIMCFQHPYMFTGDVEKNILYGARLQKCTIDYNLINTYCNRYGIEGMLNKDARKLSSGQKQCVALIRAFLVNPKLLLLDEPTANLDKKKSEALAADLSRLRQHGGSFVITHHSNQQVQFDVDYCYHLENGILLPDKPITKRVDRKQDVAKTEVSEEMLRHLELICPDVVNSGINCRDAFEFCKRFNLEPNALGRLCSDKNIKIRKCQWGCFK